VKNLSGTHGVKGDGPVEHKHHDLGQLGGGYGRK
jgi:hypothetical protein